MRETRIVVGIQVILWLFEVWIFALTINMLTKRAWIPALVLVFVGIAILVLFIFPLPMMKEAAKKIESKKELT